MAHWVGKYVMVDGLAGSFSFFFNFVNYITEIWMEFDDYNWED